MLYTQVQSGVNLVQLAPGEDVSSLSNAVMKHDDRNKAENRNGACIFPCAVRTENGVALPHAPKVVWQRKVDDLPAGSEPVYRDLTDSYWRNEAKIVFNSFAHMECKEIEDSGLFAHYNCDFHQYPCDVTLFSGTYRCIVKVQHTGGNNQTLMISSALDGINVLLYLM